MSSCPVATKFLHGCTLEQMNRIKESGVDILDILKYGEGRKSIFVLVLPEHQWKFARGVKHIEKHEKL